MLRDAVEHGRANPRDLKMELARELTARFHGAAAAEGAVAHWHEVVQGGGVPQDLALAEISVPAEGIRIGALLKAAGLAPSTSEAMRKLGERAVRVDGDVVEARDLLLHAGRRASPAARQARIRARALDFRAARAPSFGCASERCCDPRRRRDAKNLRRTPSQIRCAPLGFAPLRCPAETASGDEGSRRRLQPSRRDQKVATKVLTVREMVV